MTNLGIELFSHDAQHLVASTMAISVIDLFEQVDIPDGDAGLRAETLPALELLNHASITGAAIGNLRKPIHHRDALLIAQPLLQVARLAFQHFQS